jgi:hypothetical protein
MNTYIAYFDILGFKEFIENNEKEYVDINFSHILRDSQAAVSEETYIQQELGKIIPNLDESEINCMHISDSIIFWTKEESPESFKKIVDVCYFFYWHCIQTSFPIRGSLVYGDIEFCPFQIKGKGGATFYNNSLYGKGLINAYLKTESQDWAGCFIDKSAVQTVNEDVINELIYAKKIVYYPVPLKDGTHCYEHTIRLIGGRLNNVAFMNLAKRIERSFTQHMKGKPLSESVIRKQNNTIKFLDYFRTEDNEKI